MKDKTTFENEVKEIYHWSCRYGYDNKPLDFSKPISKEDFDEFMQACHTGFKEAQKLIIENLLDIELEKKELTEKLKEYRRNREKDLQATTELEIKTLDYREKIMRKLADSIAWHLIRGHHYIGRRLYLGETFPSLLSEGFDATMKIAEDINSNVNEFALISDITSFIQIGDIFSISEDGSPQLLEVKSGETNKLALDILKEIYSTTEPGKEVDVTETLKESDKKLVQQVERMHKQNIRASTAANTIKNEKGTDPKTGLSVNVVEGQNSDETYIDVIRNLLTISKEKECAYTVVDNILHIGVYRGKFIPYGGKMLQEVAKSVIGREFPMYNILANLSINICEPLFTKDLSEEDIFDIITGRVIIWMVIDFDQLIEFFKFAGYDARWLSTKETHRIKEDFKGLPIFIFNNQAICITKDDLKFPLGDGIISRIIGDNQKPTSVALGFMDIIEDATTKEEYKSQ